MSREVIPKEMVLSLEDGEVRTLLIERYRQQEVRFPEYTDPAWTIAIPERQFKGLEITISEENGRPSNRKYWIDSKRLILALLDMFIKPQGIPGLYRITKRGLPPDSHYQVEPI